MSKAQASLALLIWLNENALFHSTFSRHGKAQASLALLIWLNENVPFQGTFSRHGKSQASLALLIWLNENALKVAQGHLMFTSRFALVVF